MRLKKKEYISITVAIILVAITLIAVFFYRDRLQESEYKVASDDVISEDGFEVVTEKEIKLENDKILFTMDVSNSHFSVLDKVTGESYQSTANLNSEVDGSGMYLSEIVVNYYDSSSMNRTMCSQDNSVAFESFEVQSSEDAVRVYYDIRKSKEELFVPTVIPKEVFEERILAKLPSGPRRRINVYYKLRSADSDEDMISAYPELANQDLYIIIADMNSNDYREVTDYFKEVGYTAEDYTMDIEGMDIPNVSVEMPAQFLIPVEYSLKEDGFIAKVLTDSITSESPSYKLTEIQLLPNFASIVEKQNGYLMVPDGSGGIISLAQESGVSYQQQIYGADVAVEIQQSLALTEQAVMPVFGMKHEQSGFFAVIEGAAECATVQGQVLGGTNLSSGIGAEFQILTYDETNIAAVSEIPSFNLYAERSVNQIPSVRYVLLGEDECDYSSMAKWYQNYLVEQGILREAVAESESVMYLDFTGYSTQDTSFLGIPYEKNVTLSQVRDIEEAVKEFQSQGVSQLSVRLKAYSHGGICNGIVDTFRIQPDVGSVQDVKALANLLKENGGVLYLDDVVGVVYKNSAFDSFKKFTHATRQIDKMVATRGNYDIVLQDLDEAHNLYSLISPKYYQSLVEKFTDSMEKKLGSTEGYGYSWSQYGSLLAGDYKASETIERSQAKELASDAISKAKNYDSVMTEVGNIYALEYADTLLNVPLSGSAFESVTESIPFYQMVLHGYVSYAGKPLNAVSDPETEWLKTVESGASLYYTCATEDHTRIKNLTFRQKLYPISLDIGCDEIVKRYKEYEELFLTLSTKLIEKHEILHEGVHVTIYEDGTKVVVNYNSHEVIVGNTVITARNFAVNP